MKLQIDINNRVLANVIGSAIIEYWGIAHVWDRETLKMKLKDKLTNEVHYIHPQHFQRGLALMLEQYPRKFSEIFTGYDGTTGDVLIQLAAFGAVRYG